MARRVFSDFDAELQLRLGNRTDIDSTLRAQFINDGYLKVCNLFQHVELQGFTQTEQIAQGADTLTPTVTDLWFPRALRNATDGYIIRQDNLERIERAQTKPTSRPYTYYWWAGVFHFEAFADTAKTVWVWYKKIPPEFSVGSPIIDKMFDPLITMYAAEVGFETVRDFDQAAVESKLADKYAAQRKLPLDQVKQDDYRTGWRVRIK